MGKENIKAGAYLGELWGPGPPDLRFTIFIRGAQAAALPHPRPQLRHYRGAFSFFFKFTFSHKAYLNGERFKKPLWNMIFFSKCRYENEISFTIVIRGVQAASPSTTSSLDILLYSVGAHLLL